jgi:hypothetical protein
VIFVIDNSLQMESNSLLFIHWHKVNKLVKIKDRILPKTKVQRNLTNKAVKKAICFAKRT